jgi:hypothetical protein
MKIRQWLIAIVGIGALLVGGAHAALASSAVPKNPVTNPRTGVGG